MNRAFRWMHRWLGLLLAVQFVLWMASGLAMSLLDHEAVQGHTHQAPPKPDARTWPRGLLSPATVMAGSERPVLNLETAWLLERPAYRVTTDAGVRLLDARSGANLEVDATTARRIASLDYVGPAAAAAPVLLARADTEARGHAGPIWRVDFPDGDDTTLYVSASDGRLLERRNRTWRWFDIAWMLHIMDYTGREDFNNPLVVMAAGGGVWIALTGLWLLVSSLRLRAAASPRPMAR